MVGATCANLSKIVWRTFFPDSKGDFRTLVTGVAEAFEVHVLAGGLERTGLWRIGRVGIAEGQNGEDVQSVGNGEDLFDLSTVEIADPAGAEAESPGGGGHVLNRLTTIDVSPTSVGDVLEDDNRGGGVGDEFAGGAEGADFAEGIAVLNYDELPGLLIARAHRMASGTYDLAELFRLDGLGGEVALNLAAFDRFQNVQRGFSWDQI
jgi:hypothetical protein